MSAQIISSVLPTVAAVLQAILIYLLIRGPFLRYFPLFLFVVSQAVTTTVEGWVIMRWGVDREHYFPVYWASELLLDLLLFVLVISLTLQALEGNPMLPKLTRMLGVILLGVLVAPFLLFEGEPFRDSTNWNNPTAQLLNFGAALMNLGLWTALLASRNHDRQLLTVAAGLGLLVTTAALTFGAINFTAEDSILRDIADWAHRLSQVVSVGIWCWALRPQGAPRVPPPEDTATSRA